ncbi:MAG: TonB-dependent receptor, partial [Chitinophagaceae bacterium]
MGKSLRRFAMLLMAGVFSLTITAQTTVLSGTVKNQSTKDPIPSVTVSVNNSTSGSVTDDQGVFKLNTGQKPPFTLSFSSVGFKTKEVLVKSLTDALNIELEPGYFLGEEIVVSASRSSERILESPVTIERISAAAIRTSAAASYYDIIGNLKGVDITTSSLNFKTPSTRGFVGSGNVRFNQLVDGMDNQAPGLNFSLGGFIGLSELDVDNIELLPGASSALYGPGGMNGTLLIN